MMPAKSALQFMGYEVNQIVYRKTNHAIEADEIRISPQFKKSVQELGANLYDVSLGILIQGSEEQPLPFEIGVELTGHFFLVDEEEPLRTQVINQNTVAILFPFLRSTVASVSMAANVSPVILPIINLAGAFEEKEQETPADLPSPETGR